MGEKEKETRAVEVELDGSVGDITGAPIRVRGAGSRRRRLILVLEPHASHYYFLHAFGCDFALDVCCARRHPLWHPQVLVSFNSAYDDLGPTQEPPRYDLAPWDRGTTYRGCSA